MVNIQQPSEEADSRGPHKKCLLIMRKLMIRPPDSWDTPEGFLYFAKKTFPPLSARTHRKCPLIMHKKMNTPPTSWDSPWWEADLSAY